MSSGGPTPSSSELRQEKQEKKSISLRFSKALRGAAASAERAANSAFSSKETGDSPDRGGNSRRSSGSEQKEDSSHSNNGSAHGGKDGGGRLPSSLPSSLSFDAGTGSGKWQSSNPFDTEPPAEGEGKQERHGGGHGGDDNDDAGDGNGVTVFGMATGDSASNTGGESSGSRPDSAKFPPLKDNLSQEKVLSELGIGRSASWRIPIFGDFEQLQLRGNVREGDFLSFMQRRGHEPLWCRAAYTAFVASHEEGLDQFQYLLAVSALTFNRGSSDSGNNACWVSLRQLLVYNVYLLRNEEKGHAGGDSGEHAEGVSGGISSNGFIDFLLDLSASDESPYFYGITNQGWWPKARELGADESGLASASLSGNRPQRTSLELMDQSTMAESLAISKVQLASKQSEYEALELQYLKLEKQMCKLKLELADEKAKRDTSLL